MVAPFNDVPGFHDQYFMGIHHSRQAVGDDQSGFILGRTGQLGLNGTLIGRVECRCGLIENQDGRIFEQRSCNRHALLFTTREFQTALTHRGGIALGCRGDEIVNACRFGRGFNFFLR